MQDRYCITNLESDAKKILPAKRSYWGMENCLHWMLDIAFNEDHGRVRKDHAPQNFAVLRHRVLNLLKLETTVKAKRLKCGRDTDHLLKVFAGKMRLPYSDGSVSGQETCFKKTPLLPTELIIHQPCRKL